MIKTIIKKTLKGMGYEISKQNNSHDIFGYPDMEAEFKELYALCQPYTMTTIERMYALYKSVEYIVHNKIPGDMVECGVWQGGSAMMIAHSLLKFGCTDKKIYLYDTYEGMSAPTEKDISFRGESADYLLTKFARDKENNPVWAIAGISAVKNNMFSTNYPAENILFIQGKVEETIPAQSPGDLSLLRLDTDWYESTYHELLHLYPLLSPKGVLILDDYGHWKGAREATDQYFAEKKIPVLLTRVDYGGRLFVKSA